MKVVVGHFDELLLKFVILRREQKLQTFLTKLFLDPVEPGFPKEEGEIVVFQGLFGFLGELPPFGKLIQRNRRLRFNWSVFM